VTLLINVIYYYSWYAMLLFVSWLIGMATNVSIARYFDKQEMSMPNLSSSLFITITTGLGVIIYGLFFLALFKKLNLQGIFLSGLALIILAFIILYRAKINRKKSLGLSEFNGIELLWLLPLLIYVCGLLMYPLRPPSVNDELSYHLPYAKFFLQNEGLSVNEYLRYPFNALNFQLFYSLSLAVSDAFLAHIFHGGCALLIALGIFGICRSFYGFWVAYLAVAIFFSSRIVRLQMNTAYVDLGLTLFVFSSICALMLWKRTGEKRWMILSAFFLGISLGSKYTAMVFAVPLGLWVLLQSRNFGMLIKYGLISAGIGLPWYIWNYYISGNPVHPFASDLFGYYLWTAEDLSRQIAEMSRHGIQKTFLNFLSLPYYATFTNSFGSKMSILSWPFFITPFLFPYLDRSLREPLLITWFYIVFWFFSVAQILRYLLPVFPMISIISSLVIVLISLKIINVIPKKFLNCKYVKTIGGFILFTLMMILACKTSYKEILKAQKRPFDKKGIAIYLSKINDGYELMRFADAYPQLKGQPIYQLGFSDAIYFFNGKVMGDWWGPAKYDMMRPMTPENVESKLKQLGAKAIIINDKRFKYNKKLFGDYFLLIKENQFGAIYAIK
jgi:hypothetical protein